VHLRRALLLFAIVLGLAALAASVSRPPEESADRAERPSPPPASTEESPTISPGSESPPGTTVDVVFDAAREQRRRVDAGQPAAVLVEVEEPGMAEIPDLGVSSPADPLTPARFEVLVPEPGRFEITFLPAGADTPEGAGTLVVR
jgi:hypothetical protein